MSARQYRKKQTGTLGLGILAGLGMTLALYGCPSMSDLTPPPRVDGGMSTGPMDASTHAPQPDMVTASDMSVGCQIGQRDTGTGCVCDVSSCVCGTCVGNQCQPRTLASGQMIPRAIVLDSANAYFADSGGAAVMQVGLSGSPGPTAVTTQISSPLGLAVDVNNFYISTSTNGTLYRISRADQLLHTMTMGLNQPRAIASDSAAVYVVSVTNASVSKVLIADNTVTTLTSGLSSAPYALAIDSSDVYFTTADSVMRVGLDGTGQQTLVSGQTSPHGIAVDATTVYWVNNINGALLAVNKTGGTPRVIGQAIFLESVAVDATHAYVTSTSGEVLRFDKGATLQTPTVVATGQAQPYGIAVNSQCVYWTNDTATGTVVYGDK